ncbi:hypothetical protein DXG01_003912 [Tephrocybe rancida]|nr:hypothetical protein DXG01_003912 [Tephrocybe rancida]
MQNFVAILVRTFNHFVILRTCESNRSTCKPSMVLAKRAKTWTNSDTTVTSDETQGTLDRPPHVVAAELRDKVRKPNKPTYSVDTPGLVGTALALSLMEPKDIHGIHTHMSVFMDQYNIYMPDLPGFDLTRVETEWSRFRSSIPEIWKFNNDGREFQVGEAMKARGLDAEYPVVLIPGVISTGLESWSTSPDYRAFFREKLWGGSNMISQVTFNKEKWISAMMLDPVSGLDPPNIKIRAAEGIDAASSFIRGYWIWSKIIENLAVVNYDTNNLYLAPYDWRLSYANLEERDGYFSKLKTTIEGLKRRQRKKVVIAAHSMGSTVDEYLKKKKVLLRELMLCVALLKYFFKWVESPLHGGEGPDWVEVQVTNHVEAYISIAGTHLGVAKAMSAFLSGEMKDTVQMNPAGAYVLERFFSRKERQDLFRSWAGSASMWIKGGDTIWGNETQAPDDEPNAVHTHGELIAFREAQAVDVAGSNSTTVRMTSEQAGTWILEQTPSTFQKMLASNYSYGLERDEAALKRNDLDPTKWTNPLEVRYMSGGHERDDITKDDVEQVCRDPSSSDCVDQQAILDLSPSKQTWIDAAFTNDMISPKVRNGVKMGEGDGTVSLLSLGAMCVEGWKRPRWNPAGIKIVTVELPHRPVPSIPRGGANTSDHVDILGSTGLNEIILKVATGVGHEITDNYVSNIREYADRIEWD